jgi:arsenate reductase
MAEALLNHYGKGRFQAFSAGSSPTGTVHPLTFETLKKNGIGIEGLRSKSWDEFAKQKIDIVITVCNNAAKETCPVFFGVPVRVHWDLPDPAHFHGTEEETKAEFQRVFDLLAERIKAILELPENLDKADLAAKLNGIGK